MQLPEFIARQLNDHHDSPSGVEQATYTEWSKEHIEDAIYLGSMYLYTILPSIFTDTKTKVIKEPTCLVSFCDEEDCEQFVEVLSVGDCEDLEKREVETNDLLSMLGPCAVSSDDFGVKKEYQVLKNSPCTLKFKEPLPVGTELKYLCANPPESSDIENDKKFSKYLPLIADYALWWLYRTDTESRSNLDRARLHFESMKDFVSNTLLMEFTLRDDGYDFGRRRTDGNDNMQ